MSPAWLRVLNDGRITRVGDLGRVELGAADYGANGYKDHVRSVPILIYRRPSSNELNTAREIRKTMAALSKDFPPGVAYMNQYDATVFIGQSVHEASFPSLWLPALAPKCGNLWERLCSLACSA